jgi:hypothetical protein
MDGVGNCGPMLLGDSSYLLVGEVTVTKLLRHVTSYFLM